MKDILIVGELRILVKPASEPLLNYTDKKLPDGTVIQVGTPEVVWYHHDERRALPFSWEGKTYYILENDVEEPSGKIGNARTIACMHFLD